MSARARNIRKKPSETSWDSEEASDIIIQTRPIRKQTQATEVTADVVVLEDVQDRVFEDSVQMIDDEYILMEKRVQFAKEQREMKRLTSSEEFVPLRQTSVDSDLEEATMDEVGPLEMIADMGVDDEVFENLRQKTIKFGLPAENTSPSDLQYEEDEEFRAWELAQIRKGMVSGGVKSTKDAKAAAKELQKTAKVANERIELIDFETLDFYSADLMRKIDHQEQILGKSLTDMENLQTLLSLINLEELETIHAVHSDKLKFYRDELQYWSSYSSFVTEVSHAMDEKDLEKVSDLFEDCLPEYGSIECVTSRLLQWKQLYPEDYEHMFIETKVPFILEVFVQRQLLTWTPFSDEYTSIKHLVAEFHQITNISESNFHTLLKQIYLPRVFVIVTESFVPSVGFQAVRLKEILAELSSLAGSDSQDLGLFKMVISDMIETAKDQAGPEELPTILQTQSMLGL